MYHESQALTWEIGACPLQKGGLMKATTEVYRRKAELLMSASSSEATLGVAGVTTLNLALTSQSSAPSLDRTGARKDGSQPWVTRPQLPVGDLSPARHLSIRYSQAK